MSENVENLTIVKDIVGPEKFRKICIELSGSRIIIPDMRSKKMWQKILKLKGEGKRPSEIAKTCGCSARYVQMVKMKHLSFFDATRIEINEELAKELSGRSL